MGNEPTEAMKDLQALRDDLPALTGRLEAARTAERTAAADARKSGSLDALAEAQRRTHALERLLHAHEQELVELERRVSDEQTEAEVMRLVRQVEAIETAKAELEEAFGDAVRGFEGSIRSLLSLDRRLREMRQPRCLQPRCGEEAVRKALAARGVSLLDARHAEAQFKRDVGPLAEQVFSALVFARSRQEFTSE